MISITKTASDHIKKALADRGSGLGIKLGISTKGCSGLSYTMAWVDQEDPMDEKFVDQDCTIFVEPKSIMFMLGTTIDYKVTELEEGFEFVNPLEKGRCGCGESFHV